MVEYIEVTSVKSEIKMERFLLHRSGEVMDRYIEGIQNVMKWKTNERQKNLNIYN